MAPDDECGDAMLEERLSGASVRAIAKRHGVARTEVEAAIDDRLVEVNNPMRLKAVRLDVQRLERLMEPFYQRAIEQKDVQAGTVVRQDFGTAFAVAWS
jgi:hypothetical protein